MRSPRDSRDRTDEETQDRNLGRANTFKRVNTGWTARDWESSQPDRKISYLHRLPRQQRWGMHSWPQHPRQLNQDICQIHVAKKSGCHPSLSSSPRCNGSALLKCGRWDRGWPPRAVCCGDKDLFSGGGKNTTRDRAQWMYTMTLIFVLERQEREPEKSRDLHAEWGRVGTPTLSSWVHAFYPSASSLVNCHSTNRLVSRAASQVYPQGLQWLSKAVSQEKVE